MSRSNPAGFFLGVVIEVVAVVFIVSLLPKVDLRTTTATEPIVTAAQTNYVPATPLASGAPEPRWQKLPQETSYYQRHAAAANSDSFGSENAFSRQPPPQIAVHPDRPGFVEKRLDRASQGLVTSVGSYMADTATELQRLPEIKDRKMPPTTAAAPPEINLPELQAAPAGAGQPVARPRASAGTAQYQPRPWMRY